MIRLGLLYIALLAVAIVALRRWYFALCALLFLTVLMQHPSMPSMILGIQGLNPWNAMLVVILIAWFVQRNQDKPPVQAPWWISVLFTSYVVVVIVSGIAGVVDHGSIKAGPRYDAQWLFVDGVVNPLKYVLVGALFYLGANTRRRANIAITCAVLSGMCYAFLMYKSMKLRIFVVDYEDARRMTDKLVGLFANDLGKLLSITFWSALVVCAACRRRWIKATWIALAGLLIPPFVALKSRAGFLAFGAIGFLLGVVKWRYLLIVLPLALAVVFVTVPSVRNRLTTGMEGSGQYDWDEVSAGRVTNIWPPVFDQIMKSPIIGHGRYAILREDCYHEILEREFYVPTHPHNSYLEILLDAGLVGMFVALSWMAALAFVGIRLIRLRAHPVVPAVGALALVSVVGELVAGVAGSSFYPTQGTVPSLCIFGVALRVYVEVGAIARAASARAPVGPWIPQTATVNQA